ncbi:MAG: redoxin domain-containing protein [Chloroflexi bacterium]|nr:MAG: redoxin domain-containing protein [Chloroflexota bacterium]
MLPEGTDAPDFELRSTAERGTTRLTEFRGRPVVVVFYPGDFSPVCTDQLTLYNELLPEFERYDAQLLGISVDSLWSHLAFARDRKLRFPLLADFHPKGAVSKQYGVYDEDKGISERALYVIDRDGKISWSYLSPRDVNPGADGILEALEALGRPADAKASSRS